MKKAKKGKKKLLGIKKDKKDNKKKGVLEESIQADFLGEYFIEKKKIMKKMKNLLKIIKNIKEKK